MEMKFSNAFKEMDTYLKENRHTITCHEIFAIKEDFYNIVESLCGSTANLTGITEMLIFRLMYHMFEMQESVENKSSQFRDIRLLIGNRYIGKNGKFQEPDIVIEQGNKISFLISIKNLLSTVSPTSNERESFIVQELIKENGVCTTAIQDLFRIDNIRYGKNSAFNSLTVVFSQVPNRHERAIHLIQNKYNWHQYLILENNHNKFLDELKDRLRFKKPY
jgi:hypothetical protein